MSKLTSLLVSLLVGTAGCAASSHGAQRPSPAQLTQLAQQVADTERAFAKTMAERNFARFCDFLSDEAVFFSGRQVLRGKAQVAAHWKHFFDAKEAPFSWRPEQVEVLTSGGLALSHGPVFLPSGVQSGSFISTWRLEAPGVWRIVFDKGCRYCAPLAGEH